MERGFAPLGAPPLSFGHFPRQRGQPGTAHLDSGFRRNDGGLIGRRFYSGYVTVVGLDWVVGDLGGAASVSYVVRYQIQDF